MLGRLALSLAVAAGAIVSSAVAQESGDIGRDDVGMLAGSSVQTADGWQVSGSGNDIWGYRDEFHYLRFNRNADVTVTCLVNSFGPSTLESWRKAGIMFRNKNPAVDDQRLAQSMFSVTGWGIAHLTRENDERHTVSTHTSYPTSSVWLRLVKQGNTISSYVKRDGEYGFMLFNSDEVAFGEEFHVGLAVTSHNRDILGTLDVSHFEISDDVYTFPANPTDIGETGRPVYVQEVKDGVWATQAGGTDIGGTSDSFGFFGDEHSATDITATMFLEKVQWRNNDSKGGLMIRASYDADAPHVSLLVKAGDGITMYSRSTAGGDTVVKKNVGVWRDNVELRLVKSGNSVECSYRPKGATDWYVLGSASADLDGAGVYYIGHAVTSASPNEHGMLTAKAVVVTA